MDFRRIAGGMKSTRKKGCWCTCQNWRGRRITLERGSCGRTLCKTTRLRLQGSLWTSRKLKVTRSPGGERTPTRISKTLRMVEGYKLASVWQGICKFVRVGAVGDDDVHRARDSGELIGAGVGNDGDV